MANVLVNEKTLKAIADAVRARGGTSALMKPGEIPDAVSRIPSGGSAADMSLPVRFFDYEGTLLYSFSLEELAGLERLPDLPFHEGLVCTGWNWTLEDLKKTNREMNVAAQYVTRYDTASGLNGAGRVTADVLNIRSAPKSGSTSLGTASHGAVLTVTGIEGSWFAVSYNGVSGYVASQYVLICSPSTADTSAPETPEETPAETPDETPADNPAATVSGSEIVSLAQQYLGVPYVYGGSSPSGFDCSGFTMYIFAQVGVKLPHGATSQLSYGASVSRSELQPGDLVFFQDYGAVASHVGIYIGGDQFIHASSSYYNGHCVVISSLTETYYNSHYYTARRH